MFKVSNKDQWRCPGVFIVNFEHVTAGWLPCYYSLGVVYKFRVEYSKDGIYAVTGLSSKS